MYIVTFAFDLGDYIATYTGQIVGTFENYFKVTYYEPTVGSLLSLDLPIAQVIGRGYTEDIALPSSPIIEDLAPYAYAY